MPGPAKQFDRETALFRSMEVFWQLGYEGTSIQNLVDALGINRSSLYSTFGDKDSLYIEALELYVDNQVSECMAALRGHGSALDRVESMIRLGLKKNRASRCNGCFAGNTAAELGSRHPAAAKIVRATFTRMERQLRITLEQAVADGELPAGADPAALASLTMATLQGLAVMSQINEAAMTRSAEGLIGVLRSQAV